ncbi:MAG: tRNA pseudouridine(38-40) synthase TruA [Candidatus Dormiibacterota bacterium]
MPSSSYRMVIAYDGSRYHGWQSQPDVATVQGEVSRALSELTAEAPVIKAAGRTDAGAHAHGQVISFTLQTPWLPDSLAQGCNSHLPEDVVVLEAAIIGADFDPRRQAWRRTYRYLVRESGKDVPAGRQYEWRVGQPLARAAMQAGARMLLGTHDFGAFGRSPRPGGSTVRTVDRAEVELDQGLWVMEIRADAFLRGMMRNFAGALVALGGGRASLADLESALSDPAAPVRAWQTAPAHGLHQWRVEYPAGLDEMRA